MKSFSLQDIPYINNYKKKTKCTTTSHKIVIGTRALLKKGRNWDYCAIHFFISSFNRILTEPYKYEHFIMT